MIAVITGPGGAGKSTIAHEVVKHVGNCVNIVVDHVKHFISYRDFDYSDTEKGQKQWRLLGKNLGLLTESYRRHGYEVIINGYLHPAAWKTLEGKVTLTHKILLLPNLETVVVRDKQREKDRLYERMVTEHHKFFSEGKFFDDFIKIDSSKLTVEETTREVLKALGKNWGEF